MPTAHTSLHPENPAGREFYRRDKIQVGLAHPLIKVTQSQDKFNIKPRLLGLVLTETLV